MRLYICAARWVRVVKTRPKGANEQERVGRRLKILGLTTMRNEGPYVLEWIAHHLAAGFDHMLVASHDCDDGTDALLEALAKTGSVTHLPFAPEGGKSVQWQALKLLGDHALTRSADWAMFFDCDEFLCFSGEIETVSDLIQACGAPDAIALPWRLFGSGGQVAMGEGLTPERFLRAAPEDLHYPMGHLFKSLIRPAAFQKLGVHRPRNKKDTAPRWAAPSGQAMAPEFAQNEALISLYGRHKSAARFPDLARLNHYSLRSAEEFILKSLRGLPNHMDRKIDLDYWAERNFNTVEDRAILPMMAATRAKLETLLADPGVAHAHAQACAEHGARRAALRADIAHVKTLWRLGLLTGSTPPEEAAMRAFIAQQMQAKSTS